MQMVRLQTLSGGRQNIETTTLHLGSRAVEAPVLRVGQGELAVPSSVLEQFSLMPGRSVGAWTSPDGRHVHLGPVMGIVMDGSSNGPGSSRVTRLMSELEETARTAGVVPVFFSIWGVDLRAGSVAPTNPPHSSLRAAPIPDVFYNRATYADLRQRRRARRLRSRMELLYDTAPVNTANAFGKWATYRALYFFSPARGVMPETMLVRTAGQVVDFLARHGRAFLKEDLGSWGRNVVRIEARSPSGFHLMGYLNGRPVHATLPDTRGLRRFLLSRCRTGKWLMQRAIRRRRLLGRVFDFRIVMQKGADGAWHIPHVLVNWAHSGEVITNRPQTSTFMSLEQFAPHWRDGARDPAFLNGAVDALQRMSHVVADVVETRFGTQGELGLDIGVDEDGRPWLFEVNAKPYFMPGEGTKYPVLYATYLAQQIWRAKYGSLPRR